MTAEEDPTVISHRYVYMCVYVCVMTRRGVDGGRGVKERDLTYLYYVERDGCAGRVSGLDVAFEVHVEELEHEIELLIGVHDLEQPVWVDRICRS